jgi:hypothetical protein
MADRIGFIGVGTMGEPMCRNLARKSGLEIFAADRDEAPLKRLAADGVKSASLDEIAASCRTILLSLPGGKEVEQVCLGEGGLIAKAVLGWTVIDLSTSPISLARRLYAEFEGKASAFADAPVARTRQAAIDGTLSIMVGGTRDCFDRIEPLLRHMASEVTYCGEAGSGQAVKIHTVSSGVGAAEASRSPARVDAVVLFEPSGLAIFAATTAKASCGGFPRRLWRQYALKIFLRHAMAERQGHCRRWAPRRPGRAPSGWVTTEMAGAAARHRGRRGEEVTA